MDRTRSRAGRDDLRRRFTKVATTRHEIIALQKAHQELASDAAAFQAIFLEAELDAVERYLASSWERPSPGGWLTRFLEGVWLKLRHPEYLQHVEEGRTRVQSTLRSALAITERLLRSGAEPLQKCATDIGNLLRQPQIKALTDSNSEAGVSGRLAFDAAARGEGKPPLLELIALLGGLEAAWSLAVATAEAGWKYPLIGDRLRIQALIHPLLGQRGVGNNLELAPDTRVCFLTGPNMAGKSTFLKAVALAVLLAHMGCGVPAVDMEFTPVASLFSSLQINDSLSARESFYLAEVRRIKSLAASLRRNGGTVAVIDEPFRGTNVHDASEATFEIVNRLAAHPSALVFVASHLAELGSRFESDRRIRLIHFVARLEEGVPYFDYQLHEGVTEQRLGMTLLRQEGVLDLLRFSADTPA